MKSVKLKRQNSVPNKQSEESKALEQTYENGVLMISEMPLLTEAYQAKLVDIQMKSQNEDTLKYLAQCSPAILANGGIGLRNEIEAVEFLRRMQ